MWSIKIKFKYFITALLVYVFHVAGFTQAYNFNYLSIQNGLPQSQAFSISFDSDQYAWIGTQGGGICKFDGESYAYITKNDSLISNRIYSIEQVGNAVWIGQKGGVSKFNIDGTFIQNYRLSNNAALVQDIIVFEENFLFATNEGLYQLEKEEIVAQTTNPNLVGANIFQFFLPDSNSLWLCTQNGLISYKNLFGKLSVAKGLTSNHVECAVVYNGEWVLGTYEGGVNFYNKKKVYQRSDFGELNDLIILSLYVSNENELWVGTLNNGVYLYNSKDETLRNFRTSNGLSGNHAKTINADYWGNIWIGTSGGGVSIFQNSPFIEYNSSSGLNGDYVFSVLNDSKDNLWLGTEGTGVMRINDTSKLLFDEDYGFYSEKVKAIFEDSQGDIWFGTEGKGIGVYNPADEKDTVYSYFNSAGLKGSWVKSFTEDEKRKRVYVGTSDNGIFYANKNRTPFQLTFSAVTLNNGAELKSVASILFHQDKLWFVSDDGSYGYIKDDKLIGFQENNKSFRNIVIRDSVVWVGSKDDGILTFTLRNDSIVNKKWLTANSEIGIQSNNIYQLIYHNDQLWVGTEKGLDRLDLDSTNSIFAHEHFGYEEGFEGVETNINGGNVDRNGNLWFGTVDGLFVYKGRDPNKAQRKPPVLKLNEFRIVFESIENTEYADFYKEGIMVNKLVLPYDQNHISFTFKAIHYTFAKNIKYRWILEGAEPNWTPSTTINIATYPNLPPGDYTFKLQATIDELWDSEPVSISFTIDKPYWEKFWFKAAYYTVIVIVLVLIILLLLIRQKRKGKALNEKLKLEKNLLELEQKALRLQMNPHFIFNALNSIHNLIILNDSDKARYALSKFSKLMRRVLENSREKFISIDDEVETLQNYVQLERLTSNLNIDLKFEYGEDVDTAEQILPPLMIQPFVENAIVHGLMGNDQKGEIKVSFKWMTENILECSIQDNGRGRLKANEIKAQKETYHKSTALKVAQERLANLNQEVGFVPFEIIDLLDENKQPSGTKVIIRILI